MSQHQNGLKTFIYVILVKRANEITAHVIRCGHDPDKDEIAKALDIALAPTDEIQAARYDEGHLPVIPPKAKI